MKTLWIVLAIVFGCGILCCGGLFFFGKHAMEATQKVDAQADEYALQATNAICKAWNQEEVKKRMAPSANSALLSKIAEYGKKLGPIQKSNPFSSTNFSTYTGFSFNGGGSVNSVRILSKSSATFRGGDGDITIALVKKGDTWQIEDFTVVSSALDSPVKKI